MSVVYIALPVTLLLAIIGVIAFIWSVRSGQLDDLSTPGVRMLTDDDDRSRRETNRPKRASENLPPVTTVSPPANQLPRKVVNDTETPTPGTPEA